jgi:hypothetical protein
MHPELLQYLAAERMRENQASAARARLAGEANRERQQERRRAFIAAARTLWHGHLQAPARRSPLGWKPRLGR